MSRWWLSRDDCAAPISGFPWQRVVWPHAIQKIFGLATGLPFCILLVGRCVDWYFCMVQCFWSWPTIRRHDLHRFAWHEWLWSQDSKDSDSWRLGLSKLLQTSQLHFRSLPNLKSLWLVSASVQYIIIATLLGEILYYICILIHHAHNQGDLPSTYHWMTKTLDIFWGQNLDRRLGWCGGHLRVMSKLGVAFPLQAMVVTNESPWLSMGQSWIVLAGHGWSPVPKSFLLQLENPAVWDLEGHRLEVWAPVTRGR